MTMRNCLLFGVILISLFSCNAPSKRTPDAERERLRISGSVTFEQQYEILLRLYRTQEDSLEVASHQTANELLNLVTAQADRTILAQAYMDLAQNAKSRIQASQYYFKALDIYESINDLAKTITCLNAIGEIFRAMGDFERSLLYLERAVQLCDQIGDKQQLAYAFNRTGAVYFEIALKGDQDALYLSIGSTQKSITLAKELGDMNLLMSNYNIMGVDYLRLNDKTKGHNYLKQALELIDRHNYYQDKPNVLNNLANYYMDSGDYEQAIAMALESYRIASELNIQTYLEVSTSLLANAYYLNKQYKTAFDYYSLSQKYYQEGFFNERNLKIFELEAQYETEKKELLLEAQKNRETLLILLIVCISVLALIIIILIFSRVRHFKKMNAQVSQQNELIVKQNMDLEELIAERNRFFSVIAHDLRNPLTSIIGYSDLLLTLYDQLTEQEKKDNLLILKISTEQTHSLIINLLQWAYSQTGKLGFAPENLRLDQIIQENINLLTLQAENKDIKILYEHTVEEMVYADSDMVNTIIRNLLSNAIKFSYPHSVIKLSCEVVHDQDAIREGPMMEIAITDHGVGINAENQAILFKVGERTISPGTNNETGSGLGLILCQEFVSKNGGTIRVQSEPGQGSRFSFTLPLAQQPVQPATDKPTETP
ncbi:tetratricopeptide repeat-containing sensor histidine kinase [bacterium]|nr:tetratricopeptide repeat-containing sensor histidine kinase [bacterium]